MRDGSSPLSYHSIAELQALMARGELTALTLVRSCLARIDAYDHRGPELRAVLETNPDAETIAARLDRERQHGRIRGPLHGIPILLKDNIDTADRMETTAGSLALLGSRPRRDATVAARLRAAGAILLGKTNMSEWAHVRSEQSISGWSARGGRTRNPYALDRSPSASSSGSAVAVAAGYVPAALGTETWGSILGPAAATLTVGIKPTVGRTSRAGIIPVAHSQDTVGPIARTVEDAALILAAISGPDLRDPMTLSVPELPPVSMPTDVRGIRLGVPRDTFFGRYPAVDRVLDDALAALAAAGATIVEGAEIPSRDAIRRQMPMFGVILYELKADLNRYLAGRDGPIRSLADVIAFNRAHTGVEMSQFGQDLFERADALGPQDEPAYQEALALSRRLSGEQGIDAVLRDHRLTALVAPTSGPPAPIAGPRPSGEAVDSHALDTALVPAMAGYPAISLPAGLANDLPVGMTLIGRAWSEATLIAVAHANEQTLHAWRPPRFEATR